MDKIQAMVTENEDGTFIVHLIDPNYQDISIEIKCESQYNANNIYLALIGNAVNVH